MKGTLKLDHTTLVSLENWFQQYSSSFKLARNDWQESIDLKIGHTKRVQSEIRMIGSGLGLEPEQLWFAELTALLHDIGRFKQFATYHTFWDKKSVNHAELGVEVLREESILADLDLDVRSAVLAIIGYHNQKLIPEKIDCEIDFFSRLLRDADKLDIYSVVTDHYRRPASERIEAIALGLPESDEISDSVVADIMERRIVDMRYIQTLTDFKLLQVGWVFDINFHPAFRALGERDYINQILLTLPVNPRIEDLKLDIQAYIKSRSEVP